MNKLSEKKERMRTRRRVRIRKKVTGTPERPRLSVFRSNRYIYAQLIDDLSPRRLAPTTGNRCKGNCRHGRNCSALVLYLFKRAGKGGRNLARTFRPMKDLLACFDDAKLFLLERISRMA